MRTNFYCQNKCGRTDFSIEEWNATFKALNACGLEMAPDPEPCTEQCFECMAIVGDTQSKNRSLVGGNKTINMKEVLISFGQALDALKEGKKVARIGWNGKGMWLYLVPGSTFKVAEGRPLAAHLQVGEEVVYNAHIDMKSAGGSHFAWNPNQLDMLAEDWQIVE